jgi:phage gpG-like protein
MAYSPIKITFDDKDIKRRLAKVEAAVKTEAASKGLRAGSNYLIAQIKVNITNINLIDSGDLLNSVTEDDIHIGTKSYVEFGPHKIYAAQKEFGGVILPTHGPYLVFMGKDGKLVFTKSVYQPPHPYIRPAMDDHGDEALKLVGDTIGSIIDGKWS